MKNLSFFVVALFAIISIMPVYAQLADSPWPMYQQNPQHTGQSPYSGPELPKVLWKYFSGYAFSTDPAIAPDGTIYIGGHDYCLYALNPDSTEKWHFPTGDSINYAPVVDSDGVVYFVSNDDFLYAVKPNGFLKWKFNIGHDAKFPPTLGSDGTVYTIAYVNNSEWYIMAINPNGSEKWRFKAPHEKNSQPFVSPDNVVYFSSVMTYGYLYAINPDGSEKWKLDLGVGSQGTIVYTPVITSNGAICFMTETDVIHSVNSNGTENWHYKVTSDN
ncbi:PQQ-binding-like beta-propeller repeat protein, partial [bacterium]|nr:PQQ-binding-like beta-propeller repeat protein [bacterium]